MDRLKASMTKVWTELSMDTVYAAHRRSRRCNEGQQVSH